MAATTWQNLEVHEEDGYLGYLGELVEDAPANLDSLELDADGSIASWPQHLVCLPGEEPDWDTPHGLIDWAGFASALTAARGS